MRPARAPALRGAVLVSWLLTFVLSGTAAAAPSSAPSPAPAPDHVDRVIRDGRITESSGLAASPLHPGILWTHNDSGHPNRIYAIARDGSTAATITVPGAEARDWEAITAFRYPGRSGTSYVAIGDTGDNSFHHPYSRIYVLREPKKLRTQSIRPVRTIRFTFPGGPRDAEALLAEPSTGRFYVVTKDLFSSQVYRIPDPAWPGRRTGTSPVVQAVLVASSNASLITDGTFLPDGRMLIRGYGRLYLLGPPSAAVNGRLRSLRSASLPDQVQGESLTVVDGGQKALIGSEGERSPVLEVDLAELGMASGTPVATPAPSSTAQASGATGSGITSSGPAGGAAVPWIPLGLGGGGIVLLAAGAAILARSRPS